MTLHTILTPEWIHEAKLISAENPRLEGFVPSEGGEDPPNFASWRGSR